MDTLTSRPVLTTGLVLVTTALLLRPVLVTRSSTSRPKIIPSPRETLLPHLSPSEIASLPYPPDALPGGRDVPTPYGTIKVFEFGPPRGERVLLLPGISTPCVGLSRLARRLVERRGCRVMLFDYFGRGWSDAPDPAVLDHDAPLYVSQVLCALASSPVSWLGDADADADVGGGGGGGFHIVGYSFGGGLAVCFAVCFGRAVRSVTLIAPGGLVRRASTSWATAVLYSRGLFPERLLRYFVRRRFEPVPRERVGSADEVVEEEEEEKEVGDEWKNVGDLDAAVSWQLRHHAGFVPALMSSFRYGPISERYEEWGRLGAMLRDRRDNPRLPGLPGGRVLLVLGRTDPIVREEQIVPDMQGILGEEAIKVVALDGGHEVPFTKAVDIADAAVEFWEENRQVREDYIEKMRHAAETAA